MEPFHWIKNASDIASTPMRSDALSLIEAGLDAIETQYIVKQSVSLADDILSIRGHSFALSDFDRICVLGFGKTSCSAATALERILGEKIQDGMVLGSTPGACERIQTRQATHPLPSRENVAQTEHLMLLCDNPSPRDLFIVIISGGGSAMLCWPYSECEQGQRLYKDATRSGMTVQELNTVRKHISELKGGGLAARLFPAHVVGLIFSDVPGTDYGMVASGPTWPDATTTADAQAILDHYNLSGYALNETPKEPSLFTRVTNIVLVSNRIALEAMAQRATHVGYRPTIISDALYDAPEQVIHAMREQSEPGTAILAGGEFRIIVPNGGRGGRNTRATLTGLQYIRDDELFTAFASDGRDNSEACGAIADMQTRTKAHEYKLELHDYLARYDDYTFFEKTDDLIFTGPTDSNVSDLVVLLKS